MLADRIEIDPDVLLGKPVIRGTRIPVEALLRKLSEGATEANLLDAYPRLKREDIQAALAYAAESKTRDLIPEFETLDEMAEFWDTHSTADYDDLTVAVDFEVRLHRE